MSERQTTLSFFPTQGLLTCFTPPILFGLAYHDPVLWLVASLLGFTICQHQQVWTSFPPALCTCSFWSLQPNHITCGLHPSSVDAPVDIHGRSHNFPFFHPRGALLVGHQVTALPVSSFGVLLITSYRGSLVWGGAGTPVLCMMAAHT